MSICEPAGEAHVLTATADRQRKLVVGHHHLDTAFLLVDDNAADRRGLKRVDDEGRGVLAPGNDVDLLALKLLHHGSDAAALHADAGPDWIDAGIAADHADLGAAARIAGGGLDLDDAVVDFRHFLREQLLHEFGMGAAEEDLRATVLPLHLHDPGAHPLADAGGFARDLLVAADHALGAAEIDDNMTELDRLDDAGDDLAGAVLEFLVLALALGIADLLEDHLLGGLRVDAAKVDWRQRIDDEIAHLGARLELFGLLEIDLLEVVLDLLDHFNHAPQPKVAGLGIELGADVVLRAIAVARGLLDRLFHRLNNDRLVDHLLGRHRGRDREQFGAVGGNRTCHGVSFPLLRKRLRRPPCRWGGLPQSNCRSGLAGRIRCGQAEW